MDEYETWKASLLEGDAGVKLEYLERLFATVRESERARLEPFAKALFDALAEHDDETLLGKGQPVRWAMLQLSEAFEPGSQKVHP